MTFLIKDFRGKVLWGATERIGLGVFMKDFGKTEISKADITVLIHKNIFRLEVSVNNMLIM
jgi:hypothetical protein